MSENLILPSLAISHVSLDSQSDCDSNKSSSPRQMQDYISSMTTNQIQSILRKYIQNHTQKVPDNVIRQIANQIDILTQQQLLEGSDSQNKLHEYTQKIDYLANQNQNLLKELNNSK